MYKVIYRYPTGFRVEDESFQTVKDAAAFAANCMEATKKKLKSDGIRFVVNDKGLSTGLDSWHVSINSADGNSLYSWDCNQITRGSEELTESTFSFEEEVMEDYPTGILDFYVPIYFSVEKVFGKDAVANGDGYCNAYAAYDMKHGQLVKYLFICVNNGDDTIRYCLYPLSEAEQKMVLEKMRSYSMYGWSFDEAIREYQKATMVSGQ